MMQGIPPRFTVRRGSLRESDAFDRPKSGALARNFMRRACGALFRKYFASRRRAKAYRHARRRQRAFAA